MKSCLRKSDLAYRDKRKAQKIVILHKNNHYSHKEADKYQAAGYSVAELLDSPDAAVIMCTLHPDIIITDGNAL
jgi:hypothetical protein